MTRSWRRLAHATAQRPIDAVLGVVVGADVAAPLVALTFDDGPDPTSTPRVLDVLERHGARATFFMVGRAAMRERALVERIAASGHAIGHHTLDHVSVPGLDARDRVEQVLGGFAAIGPPCTRWFRPPFGHLDPATWWTARRHGHDVVAWSGHVFDWEPHDADTLATRLRARLAPGAIVLLHDAPQGCDRFGSPPRTALVEALDAVLGDVGPTVRFVTVPELVAAGRAVRRVRWRAAPTEAPKDRARTR